jgi:hypothetical protein
VSVACTPAALSHGTSFPRGTVRSMLPVGDCLWRPARVLVSTRSDGEVRTGFFPERAVRKPVR